MSNRTKVRKPIPAPLELKAKMQRILRKPPVSFAVAKAQTDAILNSVFKSQSSSK